MSKVAEIAKKYIGQTEKPGNAGFNDSEFEKKMKAVGFDKGHAWCAYFCELVCKEALPGFVKQLDKLFSASAVKTLENFKDAGYQIDTLPTVGAVVVWQMMKDGVAQWQGHQGIVVSVQGNKWIFESVEGNTNDGGGREGYIVAQKLRKTIKDVKDGLKVIGFIPVEKIFQK